MQLKLHYISGIIHYLCVRNMINPSPENEIDKNTYFYLYNVYYTYGIV